MANEEDDMDDVTGSIPPQAEPAIPRAPAQADPPVMVRGKVQKSTALPVPNEGRSVYHGSIPNTYDTPQGPGAGDPGSTLGKAIHGGLSFIQKAFGLDQQQGEPERYDPRMGNDLFFADAQGNPTEAYPLDPVTGKPIPGARPGQNIPGAVTGDNSGQTAVSRDPNHGVMMLSQHAGAMSPEEYGQIRKIIDPDGRLDDSLGNVAALSGMYDYYMSKGNVKAADQAAASMIMTLSKVSSQLGAQAQQAIKSGKYPEAANLLKRAYDYIPDGNSASVDGNNVTLRDADGNILHQGAFTPKQLFDVATGLQNGSVFWKQLIQQTSRYTGIKPDVLSGEQVGPSPAFQSALGEIGGGAATAPASAGPQAAPQGATGGTAPTNTGAAPATPPVASPAPAAVPVTSPVIPGAPVPLSQRVGVAPHPGQSNAAFQGNVLTPGYQPPTNEASLPGEDFGPVPTAPNPQDPRFQPAALPPSYTSIQSPKERTEVAKQVAAVNQQRRNAWTQAVTDYKNQLGQRAQSIKEGGFKPGKISQDALTISKDAIGAGITDGMVKNATDPATGAKFTPESAQAFLGPHLGIVTTLAAGLAADNPNSALLQDPTTAGQVAMSLALNPNNPNQPNFKVMGQTPGGQGVVIQTDDNPPQRFAMSKQNFSTLVGTMRQLQQSFVSQRDTKAQQDKAGGSGWDQFKSGAKNALSFKVGQKEIPDSSPLEGVVRGVAKGIADQYRTIPPNPDAGEKGYGPGVEPSPRMPVVNSGNPGQDTPQQNSALTNVLGQVVGGARSVQEAIQGIQNLGLEARGYDLSQGSQLVEYIKALIRDRFNPYGDAGQPYRMPVVNSGEPGMDTLPRYPSQPTPARPAIPARPYSPSDYGSAGVPYRMPVVNPGN